MNEQDKLVSKDKLEVSQEPPSMSESSPTPSSYEKRGRPYFSTASDGRVTLTFPTSGGWNTHPQASSPQPARYDPATPNSEISMGESHRLGHDRTALLRLMTDESLATVLDSNSPEPGAHSNPGANDLEAWIESSRQTIIRQDDQQEPTQKDEKS